MDKVIADALEHGTGFMKTLHVPLSEVLKTNEQYAYAPVSERGEILKDNMWDTEKSAKFALANGCFDPWDDRKISDYKIKRIKLEVCDNE